MKTGNHRLQQKRDCFVELCDKKSLIVNLDKLLREVILYWHGTLFIFCFFLVVSRRDKPLYVWNATRIVLIPIASSSTLLQKENARSFPVLTHTSLLIWFSKHCINGDTIKFINKHLTVAATSFETLMS